MLTNHGKRYAVPLLQSLAGARGYSTGASYVSVPNLGLTLPYSFGFSKSRIQTPLSDSLMNAPTGLKEPLPAAPAPVKVSTTASGLKVAAVETVTPRATFSLIVEAGSAHETDDNAGVAKYLEYLMFKSTWNRSTFRITREIEKVGGIARVKAGREFSAYSLDVTRQNAPEAIEIIMDSALNPRITPWEFSDLKDKVRSDLGEALQDPKALLMELVHRTAYDGGLGRALLVDPAIVSNLTYETVREFIHTNFVPSRMTLVAAGADETTVKTLVDPMLQLGSTASPTSASTYVGGAVNCIGVTPAVHAALAFEAKGGISNVKTVAVAEVLKALLQETTREVLPYQRKELEVKSFSPFAYLHKTSGLVGVAGSAEPAKISQLVDFLTKKLESAGKGVSDSSLLLAKQHVLTASKNKFLNAPGLAAVIGPHVLARGAFSSTEILSAVANVSAADVANFVSSALKTPATFVAYGNLVHLPRLDAIQKRLSA